MRAYKGIYQIWCVGLTPQDTACVQSCSGKNCRVVVLPADILPSSDAVDREDPVMLWVGRDAWHTLASPETGRFLPYVPQVLVLPKDCSRHDLEQALAAGFQDVVQGELTQDRVQDIVCRFLEVNNAYRDMDRMAREIVLHRELLSRKTDVLTFLLSFVREVSASKERIAFLETIREQLQLILPLEAMHSAFWYRQDDDSLLMDVHYDLDTACVQKSGWADVLLEAAQSLLAVSEDSLRLRETAGRLLNEQDDALVSPDPERLLLLPVVLDETPIGIVAAALKEACPLGRDMALALDAAMRHLAWVVSAREGLSHDRNLVLTATNALASQAATH